MTALVAVLGPILKFLSDVLSTLILEWAKTPNKTERIEDAPTAFDPTDIFDDDEADNYLDGILAGYNADKRLSGDKEGD